MLVLLYVVKLILIITSIYSSILVKRKYTVESITYKAKKLTILEKPLKLSINIYITLKKGVIIFIIIYLEKAASL